MDASGQAHPISVVDAPLMNLMGLLMQGLLAARMSDPALESRARRLRGSVQVRAGRMVVYLVFDAQGVHIQRAIPGRANARVSGTMPALLQVVTGGPLVLPVLTGKLRVGGNLLFLLSMLPLLRGASSSPPPPTR